MEGIIVLIVVVVIVVIIFAIYKGDIKRRGDKTQGTIIDIDTRSTTDVYGRVHTSYYATYEFSTPNGTRHTGSKNLGGSSRGLHSGSNVTVYYLPDRPERNTID
mgnify:CR=1 FL=1